MSVERMAELRHQLAEQQADLRDAQDEYAAAIVRAHQVLIDEHGGDFKAIGSSEDARKQAFAVAALSDHVVGRALLELRGFERGVALVAAELEALRDARKERELLLAERQLNAELGVA